MVLGDLRLRRSRDVFNVALKTKNVGSCFTANAAVIFRPDTKIADEKRTELRNEEGTSAAR